MVIPEVIAPEDSPAFCMSQCTVSKWHTRGFPRVVLGSLAEHPAASIHTLSSLSCTLILSHIPIHFQQGRFKSFNFFGSNVSPLKLVLVHNGVTQRRVHTYRWGSRRLNWVKQERVSKMQALEKHCHCLDKRETLILALLHSKNRRQSKSLLLDLQSHDRVLSKVTS